MTDDFQTNFVPGVTPFLADFLSEEQNLTNGNHTNEDEDAGQRVKKIRDLIKAAEFEAVARYIIKLDYCNIDQRRTMPVNDQVLYFIMLLNSYLFNDYVS